MKILPSLILSLILVGMWGCSDSGKNLLNPDNNDECTQELDCNGSCGGTAVNDYCGVCGGDESTCNISYASVIQPIFNSHCTACHGNSGELTLDSYSSLMASGVVTLNNGSGSLIIKKLLGTASGSQMPKGGNPLDNATINLIETWIDEGAQNN